MAERGPDPFQRRAREAGPLAPGSYRAIPTDQPGVHDFTDLESARRYADEVASEADYEDVPPTAYIYDSLFVRVDEGMDSARRRESSGVQASIRDRLRSLFDRR
jgi:hypothetical protein